MPAIEAGDQPGESLCPPTGAWNELYCHALQRYDVIGPWWVKSTPRAQSGQADFLPSFVDTSLSLITLERSVRQDSGRFDWSRVLNSVDPFECSAWLLIFGTCVGTPVPALP